MKLRNKKTGEIIETQEIYENVVGEIRIRKKAEEIDSYEYTYNSLAELNEEWEDVPEEPKEYWYIDTYICERNCQTEGANVIRDNFNKEIGNYFETKEEAEKAVEKLKAWERLKDKGVRIVKRSHGYYGGEMFWECPNGTGVSDKQIWLDLDLLFGGEE